MTNHLIELRTTKSKIGQSTEELIVEELLSRDLDFHNSKSTYSTHNLHPFPAKFPPQLPRKFIKYLTEKGDLILDPMMGSGTTLLEGLSLGRNVIGFDIDPLALLMSKVKVDQSTMTVLIKIGSQIADNSKAKVRYEKFRLVEELNLRFTKKTKEFIDFWFSKEAQIELLALVNEIETINDREVRKILEIIFSSIIITKNGGVSFAFDLAHTRPHRAKIVYDIDGSLIIGEEKAKKPSKRDELLTKRLNSPIQEFEKKLNSAIKRISSVSDCNNFICVNSNSQKMPLPTSSIDLIVTSPPYASNAIDYMRAHKFSLVWLGYEIESLSELRSEYIGGESVSNFVFEDLPEFSKSIISKINKLDVHKAQVLSRYLSEMKRVLQETYRVLKPGKSAIIVVGSSVMKGIDTETEICLAEIGQKIGFIIPKIGVRNLDRNKRMMPTSRNKDYQSQIQQRMHKEFVIGLIKPKVESS